MLVIEAPLLRQCQGLYQIRFLDSLSHPLRQLFLAQWQCRPTFGLRIVLALHLSPIRQNVFLWCAFQQGKKLIFDKETDVCTNTYRSSSLTERPKHCLVSFFSTWFLDCHNWNMAALSLKDALWSCHWLHMLFQDRLRHSSLKLVLSFVQFIHVVPLQKQNNHNRFQWFIALLQTILFLDRLRCASHMKIDSVHCSHPLTLT